MKFTTSFINAALTRLRNSMTLHTSRDRVSAAIKQMAYKANDEDKTQLDTLRHQLDTLTLEDAPMDRKRAQETLATILTGQNYALLKRDADAPLSPTHNDFNAAKGMLNNALSMINDMQHYERESERAYNKLLKLLTDNAGDAAAVKGDALSPWTSNAALCAYYRDKLIEHKSSFKFRIKDLDGPMFSRSGSDAYEVKVSFLFGGHSINVLWEVKNNEYAEFDDEFVSVELDGDDIESVTSSEPCNNGHYVFDLFNDIMSDYLRDNVRLGDDDVCSPDEASRDAERELALQALTMGHRWFEKQKKREKHS